jgi:ATP-dependent DNA helicase RecG
LTAKEQEVFNIIAANPFATIAEIADKLGKSRTAISDCVRSMKSKNVLQRVGPDKGGHWRIVVRE